MDKKNKQLPYSLGLYEKALPPFLDWKTKLVVAKKSGFDWLEISIDESDEKLERLSWDDHQKRKLMNAMQESGLWIRSMCLSAHRRFPLGAKDPCVQRRSLQILKQAVQLCVSLGIRIIQLAGYDVYYEQGDYETRYNFIKNIHTACQIASHYGVILAFETMETEFMDTVEKAMRVVNNIKSPYLQLYPDIGNLSNAAIKYNISLSKDLQAGAGHIVAAHVKETKPGQYRNLFYGEGCTDYLSALPVLKEHGVCMYTAEFWYQEQRNWQEDIETAAEFLKRVLNAVFME